jgi:chemotaxis protein methyltransferase CheR
MRALGLAEFSEYLEYLKRDSQEVERLQNILTINLSFFFRNPETFAFLEQHQFLEFKDKEESIILWSAGCANGEEPYSLAISAAESSLLDRVTIYGTDIDEGTVKQAKTGTYPASAFQYTSEKIVHKYFTTTDSGYRINDSVRARVHFMRLDLLEKTSFGQCDLIMCRNVLIYLNRSAQSAVIRNFYEQLKPSGYLVIGKVELLIGIPEVELFEVVSRAEHIYRKLNR